MSKASPRVVTWRRELNIFSPTYPGPSQKKLREKSLRDQGRLTELPFTGHNIVDLGKLRRGKHRKRVGRVA